MSLFVPGPPYQDYFDLGGFRSPGACVVRAPNSPRKWDERQGHGFSGAFLVFTGAGLSRFEIDVYAWKDEHFLGWKIFAKGALMPPKISLGVDSFLPSIGKNSSLPIKHPILNDEPHNIDQVVVEDVTGWEQDDTGKWVRTIKFIQYKAPVPVLVKAFQGPPGSPIVVKPPANPTEEIIAAKNVTIGALNGL